MKQSLLAGLLLSLAASFAYAHGDEHHEKKTFDPANAEQKEFGIAGDPKKATRTIKFTMVDAMRFTPDKITVKQGETVKFIVINHGKILHEMVIGTEKELKEHAELMKKFPNMEHDEPYMAHVQPGKSEQIVWTFNKPGDFDFACLMAGHYEAGMNGKIKVVAADGSSGRQASASATTQTVDAKVEMADGEVKKIDKDSGKITIKHGPLASLDMPGMTMVFRVKDSAILDLVKTGDKIKFVADKVGGAITVTKLEVVQ